MKIYRYIIGIVLAFIVWSFSSCTNDYLLSEDGMAVSVTFRPTLSDNLNTRSIGDASGIDRLQVVVYEGSETLSKTISLTEEWHNVQQNGITLTLIEGRSYKILFWADDKDNSAYTLTNDGKISVNYADYLNAGFAKMEEMDAFYGISEVTVGSQKIEDKGKIQLNRPFAQLNFADNTTKPQEDTHQAVVTFHSIPTAFDPFTGEIEMTDADSDSDDIVFTFSDFPTNESLTVDNVSYYYVSSNYLFAPATGTATVSATLNFGTNKFEFKGEKSITLERNKKTNVLGAIIQQPETWSVWDGIIPTSSTITTDDQNRYIIDEADDVAWLSVRENAQSLNSNSTFVMTVDINMNNGSGLASLQLPSGSTLDGDGHTIKGLKLDNALLGDVTDISIKNLNIEETVVANTSSNVTHVGVLANTLKGSNTFSNIHINKSSVSTQNGAAGGFVGYISRKDPNNREETLTVIFDDCHITETTIDGTHSEGHFVGLLRGYDNGEILEFKSNCTLTLSQAAAVATDFVSPYTEGNEGAWLADNDYTKYNGWLGDEECYRGKVYYGDKTDENNRFIPRWDGKTKITPLTDETTKLIYSAFDLANLQGSGHSAVTFKENVDLGGDGANKNLFTPISYINKLDGENHKLYNLNIFHKEWVVGFTKGTNSDTEHKNIHFVNSSVRADMNGTEVNVYVGSLCPYVQHKYVVNNITVDNGYVLGLGKLGGLIGFITTESSASLSCSNCKVEYTTIENIESTGIDSFGNELISVDFNPQGEAGGLIGFLGNDANITDCHVNNSKINCYGQNDKTIIPGRHVNRFIGDIMTINSDAIIIKDCSATGNTFGRRKEDRHSYGSVWSKKYCDLVGRAYYLLIRGDKKGSVTIVNGNSSTTIF